jgi:hypothetical protein
VTSPPDRADRVAAAIISIIRECDIYDGSHGHIVDAHDYIVALLRDEFDDVQRRARDDIKNPE